MKKMQSIILKFPKVAYYLVDEHQGVPKLAFRLAVYHTVVGSLPKVGSGPPPVSSTCYWSIEADL